jgi:hypothetical protein
MMPGGFAHVFQIIMFPARPYTFLNQCGRTPATPNTSLNWFMPALVNNRVGSLAGTNEELNDMVAMAFKIFRNR